MSRECVGWYHCIPASKEEIVAVIRQIKLRSPICQGSKQISLSFAESLVDACRGHW